MAWLTVPLSYYAALAVVVCLALALFLSLKREITALRRLLAAHQCAASQALEAFRQSLDDVRRAALDAGPASLPPAPFAGAALNLTRRSQVLRMHHRGESVAHIAAALQMPRNEVELLVKLHRAAVEG